MNHGSLTLQNLIDVACPVSPDICVKIGPSPPLWRHLQLEHTYLDVFGLLERFEHAVDGFGVMRLGLVVPVPSTVTSPSACSVETTSALPSFPSRVVAMGVEVAAAVGIPPDVEVEKRDTRGRVHIVPEIPSSDLTLFDKLGDGGFATVYRASWLHAPVAVKVLTHSKPSSVTSLAGAVMAEAGILTRIRHPHIVGVFGVTRIGAGADCNAIVLELEGESLLLWLKRCRARLARITDGDSLATAVLKYHADLCVVLSQIISGLAYCHAQNPAIVHRDVKPANIVVSATATTAKSSRILAKLIDFGTASVKGCGTEGSEVVCVKGTAKYLSPEGWRGIESRIDASSDVYSFGVTMIACISGRVCFHDQPVDVGDSADQQWRWIRAAVMKGVQPAAPSQWADATGKRLTVKDCKRAHPQVLTLITQSLSHKAADRPTALDIARALSELAVVLQK